MQSQSDGTDSATLLPRGRYEGDVYNDSPLNTLKSMLKPFRYDHLEDDEIFEGYTITAQRGRNPLCSADDGGSRAWMALPCALASVAGVCIGMVLAVGLMMGGILQPSQTSVLSSPTYDEIPIPPYMLRLNADPSLPRTFLWDINELVKIRNEYRGGNPSARVLRAVNFLAERVHYMLPDSVSFSVTTAKEPPASGDRHDYQSYGYYWWPCDHALRICNKEVPTMYNMTCDKKTGLPWVNCDGEHNIGLQERSNKHDLESMADGVASSSLLWWITGEDKYGKVAARLARVWFLDEKTRMNPNFNFAQWVPGLEKFDSVVGYGVIELLLFSEMLDGLALLRGTQHWEESQHRRLMRWMRELLDWLMNSHLGRLERSRGNNHGVWFHQTALSIALHTDRREAAREIADSFLNVVVQQILADGRMPEELARSRPIHYTCYGLTAFLRTAMLSQWAGVDVISRGGATTQFGNVRYNRLRAAVTFALPFATQEITIPYPDIDTPRMEKEQLGSMWYECTEPFTLAIRAFGDADIDLEREIYRALELNEVAVWRNMPRTFGVPVDAVYTYTAPAAPARPAGVHETDDEEIEEDEELSEDDERRKGYTSR